MHYLHDFEGYRAELRFLRDLEKREVDFLVTIDKRPWLAVEVKLSDTNPSPALSLFKKKWSIPFVYQVVRQPEVNIFAKQVRVISADKFLAALV